MKERQRWQPEEDSLLRAYVKQYGPKEWNLIPQRMGKPLNRDPKSCLERWKNYLKPGLKKGSLTPEEQSLVISLQAKYGNKWKKIASEVPGRTAKRLGKWWEVFQEKQLKLLQKNNSSHRRDRDSQAVSGSGTPEKALQGPYDHILETFAEKYVQPKLLYDMSFQPSTTPSLVLPTMVSVMPMVPDADPVLSLGSVGSTATSSQLPPPPPSLLPPWMNMNPSSATSSLSSSSPVPSPSASLSLSPCESVLDSDMNRFLQSQQLGTLLQYCKELEEGKQIWLQHKKEATWRLSRLEQQLESEKARKSREKMEEIEAKIRCLREEETTFMGRVENEYRDQIIALQRDAESKEAKLVEAWSSKQLKLTKLVEQISVKGIHGYTINPN